MWNPTCKSDDPGKVTDAEYFCATTDGGGVHTNSGVPNHGYALLVDGGTYNGQASRAIGLMKAAHMYWRAQSVYQTPTTKFATTPTRSRLRATDLIGVNLEGLSTTSTPAGPSGQIDHRGGLRRGDDMIAAVELRTDPRAVQLPADPAAGHPEALREPEEPVDALRRGLRGRADGLDAHEPGRLRRLARHRLGQRPRPCPEATPAPRPSARTSEGGNCDGGAGDVSGVMRLQSPSIKIPDAATLSPRLTFEHYVATEAGWDGGNMKISINGGPFVVPASAFHVQPVQLDPQHGSAGNTNPLAGQPGFTGTDGGEVHGSWGMSQINLRALGVKAGDTIRLRFDFGMDGCTGIDGWYVDNIKLQSCNTKKNPVAALPSRFTF